METEDSVEKSEKEISPFDQLRESWASLTVDQRHEAFYGLPREDAEELYITLSAGDQHELIKDLQTNQKRVWIRIA
jgi:Mg/Co/Ni transporter MgtE